MMIQNLGTMEVVDGQEADLLVPYPTKPLSLHLLGIYQMALFKGMFQ